MTKFVHKNYIWLSIVFMIMVVLLFYLSYLYYSSKTGTVKVGILFSSTGLMAQSEQPVINATLLAIDQINEAGGINKKMIVPVVYDAASSWPRYAELAERMIVQDQVKVIFGGWTSASRKEIKPVVEKYNNLLIYPNRYEGAEESKHIIYLGPTANQQLIPAVSWMILKGYRKFYIVGADSIYSHVVDEILAYEIKVLGGELLGIVNLTASTHSIDDIINQILEKHPDAILNTIRGNTNITFLNTLYRLTKNTGIPRPKVMSFSLSTADMLKIQSYKIVGDYSVWSYFKAQDTLENKLFLDAYQQKYKSIDFINDAAMTAYSGVFLWAQAVKQADSFDPILVRQAMLRESFASPSGVIYIDPRNGNAWRMTLVGQINKDGKFDIVWSSQSPIEPIVYLNFKTKTEWDLFEYQLYLRWNRSWENPE